MWFRPKNRDETPKESEKALCQATQNLHRTKARAPEVTEISKALKGLRERNHFAEQLRVIMEGYPQ